MTATETALWHDFWSSVADEDWLAAARLPALTTGEPFPMQDLARMDSGSKHVWQALVEWAEGTSTLQART